MYAIIGHVGEHVGEHAIPTTDSDTQTGGLRPRVVPRTSHVHVPVRGGASASRGRLPLHRPEAQMTGDTPDQIPATDVEH